VRFGVRQRRARQLMASLPALMVGNAVAVDRQALLRLEAIAREPFRWEVSRHARMADTLDAMRRDLAAPGASAGSTGWPSCSSCRRQWRMIGTPLS